MIKRVLLSIALVCVALQSPLVAMQPVVGEDKSCPQNLQLLAAARENSVEGISVALEQGAYIDFQGENRESALHVAVKARALDNIDALVKKGINVFLRDASGQTALQLAASLCYYDALFLIIRGLKEVRSHDYPLPPVCSGDIRAFDAVYRGDLSSLLSCGSSCNAQIPSSMITPIMLACQMGKVEMVNALVFLNVNYNIVQLLRLAVLFGHMNIVKYLLSIVQNIEAIGNSRMGEPPLNTALHCERYDIAAYMSKRGVPIDVYSQMFLAANASAKAAFDCALVSRDV